MMIDDFIYHRLLGFINGNNTKCFIDTIEKMSENEIKNFDVHHEYDRLLRQSCYKGNIALVKFLLTSSSLIDKANIHACEGEPIIEACQYNYTDIVQFLLTNDNLKEKADIHIQDDLPFILAVTENAIETIEYLIFDYHIEYTDKIKYFLKENNEVYSNIEKMFQARNLDDKLKINLPNKQSFTKKNKL